MDANYVPIHYNPEEPPLGEMHDPMEESEVLLKCAGLSRGEARKLAREHGIPRKDVVRTRRK